LEHLKVSGSQITRRLALAATAINVTGTAIAWVYLGLLVRPPGPAFDERFWILAAGTVIYLTVATFTAIREGRRIGSKLYAWIDHGTAPATREQQRDVLMLPKHLTLVSVRRWALALPFCCLAGLMYSGEYALNTAQTILLVGMTTCAAVYLSAERILRPAVALVLASAPDPPTTRSLGIAPRIMLTWLLCTGVPLILVALVPLGRSESDPGGIAGPIWFLVGVAFVAGLLAMKVTAVGLARPISGVRRAMDAVATGDVEVSVAVDDGSEVGRLQAGFNAMVGGLRERELLRDLFGRQVGADVARDAIERGVALGGEARQVSVLFADVIGSTQLAVREPPQRVVTLLNCFFAVVVETVEKHGGSVDKFEGDAALCVFGAPVPCEDHASRALAAAEDLRRALDTVRAEAGIDAAIGVSCGEVVAGNVGTESRFEYTVIGDPVNEAARLTELAKREPTRVLASMATVHAAGVRAAARWVEQGSAVLRGREVPTPLAVPRSALVVLDLVG
jgi:adenylate cyclase